MVTVVVIKSFILIFFAHAHLIICIFYHHCCFVVLTRFLAHQSLLYPASPLCVHKHFESISHIVQYVIAVTNQTSVIRLVVCILLFGFEKCVLDDEDENVDGGLDIIG